MGKISEFYRNLNKKFNCTNEYEIFETPFTCGRCVLSVICI